MTARNRVRLGYFAFEPNARELKLVDSAGFSHAYLAHARSDLLFRPGESRGLVGLVSQRRAAIHVPDTTVEPRWIGGHSTIRSAYLVPIVRHAEACDVMAILSSERDAFDEETRRVIDAVVPLLVRALLRSAPELPRLRRLEDTLNRVALTLEEMGLATVAPSAPSPPSVAAALHTLSRRELDIFRRLRQGDRVATISRDLYISPHTTRNHLKSIFKKLGVASQAELLERTRSRIPTS